MSRIHPIIILRTGVVTAPCFHTTWTANGMPIPTQNEESQTFWTSQVAAGLCLQAYWTDSARMAPASAAWRAEPFGANRSTRWGESLHPDPQKECSFGPHEPSRNPPTSAPVPTKFSTHADPHRHQC
jgi:hypothetical protein